MEAIRGTRLATALSAVALVAAIGGTAIIARAGGGASNGKIVGYARVSTNGGVSAAKNIADRNVSAGGGGIYCFDRLPFSYSGAQITIDFAGSGSDVTPQFSDDAVNCQTNDDASVTTFAGGGYEAAAFFIAFYK